MYREENYRELIRIFILNLKFIGPVVLELSISLGRAYIVLVLGHCCKLSGTIKIASFFYVVFCKATEATASSASSSLKKMSACWAIGKCTKAGQ